MLAIASFTVSGTVEVPTNMGDDGLEGEPDDERKDEDEEEALLEHERIGSPR